MNEEYPDLVDLFEDPPPESWYDGQPDFGNYIDSFRPAFVSHVSRNFCGLPLGYYLD